MARSYGVSSKVSAGFLPSAGVPTAPAGCVPFSSGAAPVVAPAAPPSPPSNILRFNLIIFLSFLPSFRRAYLPSLRRVGCLSSLSSAVFPACPSVSPAASCRLSGVSMIVFWHIIFQNSPTRSNCSGYLDFKSKNPVFVKSNRCLISTSFSSIRHRIRMYPA